MKMSLIPTSQHILEQAIVQYQPRAVALLLSGGYDSLCTTHLAFSYLHQAYPSLPCFAVHIRTGIGIEETSVFVRQTCALYGWPLEEWTTPSSYQEIVLQYGFPGPAMHRLMYIRLKERPLMQMVRAHKKARHDTILLVTGVRRQESRRRMGHVVPFHREGTRVWCAPLLDWHKEDILDYKSAFMLPSNEVVDLLHKSGECLCGAFARPGELQELKTFYPAVARTIETLEAEVRAAGFPWGWEEEPPAAYLAMKRGQLCLPGFSPLCHSCEGHQRGAAHNEDA
jgi:3'-phosphoadenosine 5'-phosphosulfate sulfotransferase (PAPS reductase)/FAD synthetase